MLTFSNSGLFYRFLTFFAHQYPPYSVCDLFWRIVYNSFMLLLAITGVALYFYGVVGWFSEGVPYRVIISTISAAITADLITWASVYCFEMYKERKRKHWQRDNPTKDWFDYQFHLEEVRTKRRTKLKPLGRKILNGLEVVSDLSYGLYSRIHDKTCVRIEFEDKKKVSKNS